MGLDTTHGCWHGPYSAFHRWRSAVAAAAGLGPLDQYEGFGGSLKWDSSDPLTVLLSHSDCDGELLAADCAPIADRLESLLPLLAEGFGPAGDRHRAQEFIKGLRLASAAGENVVFQ